MNLSIYLINGPLLYALLRVLAEKASAFPASDADAHECISAHAHCTQLRRWSVFTYTVCVCVHVRAYVCTLQQHARVHLPAI